MATTVDREAADAVAWLQDEEAAELLRLLRARDWWSAGRILRAVAPELEREEQPWVEALVAELEFRLAGAAGDPDEQPTREIPNYTRFALRQ
jgi:hypothetical protein